MGASLTMRPVRLRTLTLRCNTSPVRIWSFSKSNFKVVSKKKPNLQTFKNLIFAFNVCRNVKSNAIVLAKNNTTIGIGSAYVDNVYETSTFEIVQSPTGVDEDGVGIGTTHMKRVFVKIGEHLDWSGQWPSFTGVGIQTGNYFGSYSWGKIILPSRSESNSYNAYTDGGVGGISTSMVVRRSAALKYKNFKTS